MKIRIFRIVVNIIFIIISCILIFESIEGIVEVNTVGGVNSIIYFYPISLYLAIFYSLILASIFTILLCISSLIRIFSHRNITKTFYKFNIFVGSVFFITGMIIAILSGLILIKYILEVNSGYGYHFRDFALLFPIFGISLLIIIWGSFKTTYNIIKVIRFKKVEVTEGNS